MSKENVFMGTGVDALFGANSNPNEYEAFILLDDIEIEAQVREEFEDNENSLIDLGRDLRKRQIQPIGVRPNRAGRQKPFLLVYGERRCRAANLEGLSGLQAKVMDLTDEEAEDVQLAENIHRKNLTQIEEAKKIQRDLDKLKSVDKVLAKHNKSRAWLSKILGLLSLPEQTTRLVSENISSDIEVISTVKTIEKQNPEKAKALVDDLKKTRGKENAREKVAVVKNEVKPKKENTKSKQSALLSDVVNKLSDSDMLVADVIASLNPDDLLEIEVWCKSFFINGSATDNPENYIIGSLQNNLFSGKGSGCLALAAFLQGMRGFDFDLEGIFHCISYERKN